jgi:hypothetical protein
MTTSETNMRVAELLDAVLDHLDEYELPEPYGVQAHSRTLGNKAQVSVHLAELGLLAVARALHAWASTLDDASLSVWRPPLSDAVHVQVSGRLVGGVPIEVWAGVKDSRLLGSLEPDQRQTLHLILLRAWIAILAFDERAAANAQAGGAG